MTLMSRNKYRRMTRQEEEQRGQEWRMGLKKWNERGRTVTEEEEKHITPWEEKYRGMTRTSVVWLW